MPDRRIHRPFRAVLFGLLALVSAAASAALTLDGEPVQGALLIGHAPPDHDVVLDGEPLLRTSDGSFLVGFARDDTEPRRLVVTAPDGERIERVLRPADREFDIQRIDGLPPSQVTPDPEAMERIRAEAALTRAARERRDDRADFRDGFIWPMTGPITGVYGSQRILNGEPRNPHWGIDIAAPTGTPVVAPASGIVTLVHDDMYFSGGTLLLDHGLGLSSAFLHLHRILVEEGQRVEQGEVIAEVGATGRVTGPHLDWRMNLGPTRVDPGLLLPGFPNPPTDDVAAD
ncbi:M23 family metallopeptidase [Wenzhouxiangella sp. XN79A]|uniref:M23 family metallopeptidase n=1 Tax=Wenzhouxiangella sp. XN79A TaxID=2724193 RepID=UPI00144AD736|nr:M23 family metallopeptidase [Wenzhouxiangella sp. XN79A]NKI34042.1 M23 family metallopeptidase [Wenzhouxiangella sp. XN79A]